MNFVIHVMIIHVISLFLSLSLSLSLYIYIYIYIYIYLIYLFLPRTRFIAPSDDLIFLFLRGCKGRGSANFVISCNLLCL